MKRMKMFFIFVFTFLAFCVSIITSVFLSWKKKNPSLITQQQSHTPMFSRSFYLLHQQQQATSTAAAAAASDAPCGIPSEKFADTTGNSARIGGLFRRVEATGGEINKYAQLHPFRFSAFCVLFVGAIFYYEANVTHGGRIKSFSHDHEYQVDTSSEGQQTRRVKAEKILSPKERQEIEDKLQRKRMLEEAKARGEDVDPRLEAEFTKHRNPGGTLLVTRGHLQDKESSWNVRNHERNWSILAQDHFKQKDNYMYRLERSKDDDFGRHSGKA